MNIEVPQLKGVAGFDPHSASQLLDALKKNSISYVPWPQFNYKPDVSFALGYTDKSILLKYYVQEKSFKAVYNLPNEPVYQDSCVEFFISPDSDENYYNFEFNSVGTCLAAYGRKGDRTSLPPEVIECIKYQSVIKAENSSDKVVKWEITLVIPLSVFTFHEDLRLQGKICRANFYKCGDEMTVPHFNSWNNIESEDPDFHLPDFFGQLRFI